MTKLDTYKRLSHYDPTHTTALRDAFAKATTRRFVELKRMIKISIVEQDCFGLKKLTTHQMSPTGQGAFAFTTNPQKLSDFIKWLEEQIDKGILTVGDLAKVGSGVDGSWLNKYILDSYKRGLVRAKDELRKAGYPLPNEDVFGSIESMLSMPISVNTLALLYTRVFSELKGITAQMSTQISKILAQGLADGDGPALLARKLVATIDGTGIGSLAITDTLGRFIPAQRRAILLARTEIIRAHHLATINMYREWGVEGVIVEGEWKTAGDDRVCEKCAALEGKTFSLDEIEKMIPYHPGCRCIALPKIKEIKKV